jgi:hypothetical protein
LVNECAPAPSPTPPDSPLFSLLSLLSQSPLPQSCHRSAGLGRPPEGDRPRFVGGVVRSSLSCAQRPAAACRRTVPRRPASGGTVGLRPVSRPGPPPPGWARPPRERAETPAASPASTGPQVGNPTHAQKASAPRCGVLLGIGDKMTWHSKREEEIRQLWKTAAYPKILTPEVRSARFGIRRASRA